MILVDCPPESALKVEVGRRIECLPDCFDRCRGEFPLGIRKAFRGHGRQIVQAKETFVSRNVELAEDLALQDTEVDQLNRQVFRRAVDIGDDVELREWAMFMVLMARALERIGDNTVDVAEQTVFLVTGELRELVDVRHSRTEGRAPDRD